MLKIAIIFLFLVGWVFWIETPNDERRAETLASLQAMQDNLNDPTAPPILSSRMLKPDWSIRYWLGIGKKNSDCVMADEMMDNNATVKYVTRRSTKAYYLSDYMSSCQNSREQRYFEVVKPKAEKWCQFRHETARLEEICTEWTENKEFYLQNLRAAAGPTIERYRLFTGR
jgi:hypothetical protein